MKILLTNDDGPLAPGLGAFRRALADLGEVTTVLPARESSGMAHAVTFALPLRARRVPLDGTGEAVIVDGTPADCVKLAVLELMDGPPDLVASGPNLGVNLSQDVFYSGTVAAALEGALLGIRSVAFSTAWSNEAAMDAVAVQSLRVLRLLLEHWPDRPVAFNVNIPVLDGREPAVRFTTQSARRAQGGYARVTAPFGRVYHWLDELPGEVSGDPLGDVAAIGAGHISVTPLLVNLTDRAALDALRDHAPGEAC